MSKHSQNHISRVIILSKLTVVCVLIGWGWLFLIGLSFLLISRIEKQVDNPDTSGILWSLVYLIVISVFASFIFNLIAVVIGIIALKKNGKCSYTLFGIIAGLVGIIVFGILLTAYYSKQRANQISLETAHKELGSRELNLTENAVKLRSHND